MRTENLLRLPELLYSQARCRALQQFLWNRRGGTGERGRDNAKKSCDILASITYLDIPAQHYLAILVQYYFSTFYFHKQMSLSIISYHGLVYLDIYVQNYIIKSCQYFQIFAKQLDWEVSNALCFNLYIWVEMQYKLKIRFQFERFVAVCVTTTRFYII